MFFINPIKSNQLLDLKKAIRLFNIVDTTINSNFDFVQHIGI